VLRISFEIASSCISTPLPVFLEVFKAVLVSTLYAEELFCHNHLNGLNVSIAISVVGIRKNQKVTNMNNMAHAPTL